MRSILPFFVFTILSLNAFAQMKMPAMTKHDLATIQQIWKADGMNAIGTLTERFPVYKMNGQYIISMIAKVNTGFNAQVLKTRNIEIGSRIGNIVTIKFPLIQLNELYTLTGVDYIEIAGKVSPHLDKAVKDVRADSVHRGINLPQSYTGKNVYIGVADWGFDYTHPMYYDTAMNATRIAAAWDQYKQSGPSPAGFNYGTEYASAQELIAAHGDTANIYSYGYHGGHVAGIAGGGGAGTVYRGVAFESEFLFATFLIDAGAVLDAYQWMYNKAVAANKRLVINQSWGLHYMGNLDGTSLLSEAIDNYSSRNIIFASSAGNNGNVAFHLKKNFTADTLKSKIDFYSYSANPNMWGQSISVWGQPTKKFSVGFKVSTNATQNIAQTLFYNTATTPQYIDTFLVIGADTVFYNLSAEAENPLNQRPHVRLRVKNKNTSLRIILHIAAEDGLVHAWNVTELTNGVGNWGMPFSNSGTGAVSGDFNYGISEPSCAKSAISVAAHNSEFYNSNQVLNGGEIASFSSYGPTLDERIKPDISAPGVNIGSAVSSYTDNSFSTTQTITFNGRDYKFTKISGTSMSSPMITGIIALLLEANPYLSATQVKDILKTTARTDVKTGIIPAGGSVRWGSGKADAYNAVKLALNTVSVTTLSQASNVVFYPNPTTGKLNFLGDLQEISIFHVYTTDGKMLMQGNLSAGYIDLSALHQGMYIIKIQNGNDFKSVQVIKE